MKVVIMTNSLTGGGAERAMNLAANLLHEAGNEVVLVAINKGSQDLVKVIPRTILLERNTKSGIFQFIAVVLLFRKSLADEKPDVLFLNCDLPEFLGCFAPLKVRLFVIEHANPAWSNRQIFGRIVRGFLRLRGVTFGAVSDHLTIWPKAKKPSFILPNLITLGSSLQTPRKEPTKIQRIVFIGRLALIQKRPDWIIEIAKQSSMNALIIGDGNARDILQNMVNTLNLNVILSDFQENPWDLITPNDLLIVPSSFEGDGLVVIEAITRSIPLVVSDIRDFRRFEFPEINYCKTIDDFVERLRFFSGDSNKLVISPEITQKIVANRSPENVLKSWEQVISHLSF